jgi:hypothetical protein
MAARGARATGADAGDRVFEQRVPALGRAVALDPLSGRAERGRVDWLGTGTVAKFLRQYRAFKKARAFVRGLKLKSEAEWREYCNSGKKPADIPAYPGGTYAKTGWAGMGDWLGSGAVATRLRQYRSFKKARAFVRGLKLKSYSKWRDYSKSGKRPADIPASPDGTYAETGWTGWGDWLGTGAVAPSLRQYRSFKKARAFVRGE